MKFSLLQYHVVPGAGKENLERLLALTERAAGEWLVAPELALTGYGRLSRDEALSLLEELRRSLGASGKKLLFGHPVWREERVFNGAYLLSGERLELVAEKRALFPGLDACAGFSPGRISEIFALGEGLFAGVLLCYELRFPEFARRLVSRGAGVLFVLAQWPESRREHLLLLARARAVENQVFVVVANALGRAGEAELSGESLVISPGGEILACAGKEETVLTVELDPEELAASRRLFNTSASPPPVLPEEKIKTLPELLSEVSRRRRLGHRMVFTNGCFDLLHAGHVSYLHEARSLGDFLVVGLNSDTSVRRLKGPERPINPETQRALVLASLSCVDYVVIFEEDTPERLIRALSPEILVKGADWPEDRIVGADYVKARGGRVVRIPFRFRVSTTRIMERIKRPDSPAQKPAD
ncbi:D-glycero-beta-D-manno-heptose 1-phosphate adenylyltransferase [Thermosulfurimonas sp.]|uniref:D-glycero-beta-D-manno-heptose 1-phosphate adenylyltransferase n=1 Tax=Thermosulfurimonas sp. TaxID=2080236 RepID=UPI0025FE1F06|nr:D-glycero-beta-D-manno-heptose 1-phosphate adenylyltransferase [Thermosulfurimonas sp.]